MDSNQSCSAQPDLINNFSSLVIGTCIYAPYTLAFFDIVPDNLNMLDSIINYVFMFDIFINLISAYQDENFEMVEDHWVGSIL